MNRADPFTGYSFVLRTIVYVIVPAFTAFQLVRLRRALHVFQLEAYKRPNFRRWVAANRDKAWFLRPSTAKKPLVMTGRAWRILVTAALLSLLGVLLPSAVAHLWLGGAPADLITWALATAALFVWAPLLVPAADWLLTPVQRAVNARYVRAAKRKLDAISPVVVGVTGSYGKTSTKFAVGRLLGDDDEVLVTPGSYNTTMGVVRAINEGLEPRHRYLVVEMGARQRGDIAEIGRLVRHEIAVLTAIGTAHLESFGSREAIKAGKLEIVGTLRPGGVAIVNSDDPTIRGLRDELSGREVVRYGLEPDGRPDVTATDVVVTRSGTEMTVVDRRTGASVRATTRLLGRHSIGHVLAGVAVAVHTGRDLDSLRQGIAALTPVEHRLQLIEGAGGVTVLDDAFNSNPDGAAAALEVLESMPARQRIVVTPGIVELGELQRSANEELGRAAAAVADVLIVVARLNREAIVDGAEGGRSKVVTVASLGEATEELSKIVGPGDVVLFENDLPDQYEG
ncbi:MAG TPA: UDP-N-acetylmuramoyl-tripeptide--D-alanyl-D-alanine ligase [Actinomycetota bacterium]|nr:UDP-N-acetylmuramoyl-tripeptide--D-alanyl-D-alanine ligase [Actinomycetota bacterium]